MVYQNYVYPNFNAYNAYPIMQNNAYSNLYSYNTNPVAKNNMTFEAKPKADVVEIKSSLESDKKDKKGLSKGAKWGIGAVIVALAALALTRGRGSSLSGAADDAARAAKGRVKSNVTVEELSFEELPKEVQKAINEQKAAQKVEATVVEVVETPKRGESSLFSEVMGKSQTRTVAEEAPTVHKRKGGNSTAAEVKPSKTSTVASSESFVDDSMSILDDTVDTYSRGMYGQDLYDSFDPRNKIDPCSPYYESSVGLGDDFMDGLGGVGGFDPLNPIGF